MPELGLGYRHRGERALHVAARSGHIELIRLMLGTGVENINAADSTGRTPLFAACDSIAGDVGVVQLLLEGGADPSLTEDNGVTPMHITAFHGHTEIVDILYSAAPAMLNHCTLKGGTPLKVACQEGREGMVSKLLELGAMQPLLRANRAACPLVEAVAGGFTGIVRILINKGGMRAVGGEGVLPTALACSVKYRQAVILRLLLTAAGGEQRRSEWANVEVEGRSLVHFCAGYCFPAALTILLKAGADERTRDQEGCYPRDVIGHCLDFINRGEEVAIRRILDRGPAYRSRPWAWHLDEKAETGGGVGHREHDTASAASLVAAAAAAAPPYPPAMSRFTVKGLEMVRPKENTCRKVFASLISRYCAKE